MYIVFFTGCPSVVRAVSTDSIKMLSSCSLILSIEFSDEKAGEPSIIIGAWQSLFSALPMTICLVSLMEFVFVFRVVLYSPYCHVVIVLVLN